MLALEPNKRQLTFETKIEAMAFLKKIDCLKASIKKTPNEFIGKETWRIHKTWSLYVTFRSLADEIKAIKLYRNTKG